MTGEQHPFRMTSEHCPDLTMAWLGVMESPGAAASRREVEVAVRPCSVGENTFHHNFATSPQPSTFAGLLLASPASLFVQPAAGVQVGRAARAVTRT